jgi:hypothetical protein
LVFVALVGVIFGGVNIGKINVSADEIPTYNGNDITSFPSLEDCSKPLGVGFIGEDVEVGPCVTSNSAFKRIQYNCKRLEANAFSEFISAASWSSKDSNKYAICKNMIGNSEPTIQKIGANGLVNAWKPWEYADNYCSKFERVGTGVVIKLQDEPKTDAKVFENCKGVYRGFCAFALLNNENGEAGKSADFCNVELKFNGFVPNSTTTDEALNTNIEVCKAPTPTELAEIKKVGSGGAGYVENRLCKIADGGIYYCETAVRDGKATKCTGVNKTAKDSVNKTVSAGFGSGIDPARVDPLKNGVGGIFSILYKIIGTIIFVLLFIVRYLQMIILLLFIAVMTVLLNLSPNSSLLTSLAVPLWGIFAQIANLGAVFILIYLGSATMIGIMKYDEAIKRGTMVALYTFVASFTYFGLAFVISLLDGFVKLIVYVFGGGSTFKLFEALIGSVSSISKISGGGQTLIPDIGKGFQGAAEVFGKSDTGITTTLIQEIIVVIGLTFILIVFKNVFFMLLTRVAILLLLLITSPLWVLGYLVKDSLPSTLKGQMDKAVELTVNSIVFNFAFVITLVLVTIITQRINEGASKFITENLANALIPQTNSGLALLDPVTASAQVNTAVDSAFGDFGLPFLNTISIIVVLSLNLVIIQQAFKFVETLIDQNIVQAGQAVSKQVSKNLNNFRKADSFKQGIGMLGKDLYSGATKAITGDNQLIGDGFGAGLKGASMADRGVRTTYRGVKDGSLQKGVTRRTAGVLDALNIPKNGFNVVGNLQKNWGNTVAGGDAKRRADKLDSQIKPLDNEIVNLGNKKKQTDDRLQENLDLVENNLTGAAKAQFDSLKQENQDDIEMIENARTSIKEARSNLAAEMAKTGQDINDPANQGDSRVIALKQAEANSKVEVKRLENKLETNENGMRDFLQSNGTADQNDSIRTLRGASATLKSDIESKESQVKGLKISRAAAKKAEGHEKLDILKQQAKNLKNQNDYNSSKVGGFLNNYETLSKGIDKLANMDNPQEIENLRKTVGELKKQGRLTDDQVAQIENNLSKGKTDQEKAVADILEAIKASKAAP